MLGGWNSWRDRNTDRALDGERERWRPDMAAIRAVIKFVQSTDKLNTGKEHDREEENVEE